jgi:hypothetical protein
MPRSTYVYVVCHNFAYRPLGLFTVKHEAITWAKKRADFRNLLLYRARDGETAELILLKWPT